MIEVCIEEVRSMRRTKSVVLGCAFLLVFLFSYSGPLKAQSPEVKKLYEAAKKEGKLVLHDGGTIEEIRPIINAFEQQFPGIKVEAICQPAPTIPTRIIAEYTAGKLSIDAASQSVGGHLINLIDRGIVRKVNLSNLVRMDPENMWMGGYLYVETSVVPVWGYNTNVVAPADVPKSWEDLLDPKWKGKIYMSGFGNIHGSMFFTRPENEVVNYLKKFRAQDIVLKPNPRTTSNAIATGEAAIGETFTRVFIEYKQRGAPVDIAPIGPQVYIPDGTCVFNGSPHPNAADLWTAWRQMPEGRAASLKFAGEAPEIRCENSPSARWRCEKGIKIHVINTLEEARRRGEFEKKVQDLLGLTPGK